MAFDGGETFKTRGAPFQRGGIGSGSTVLRSLPVFVAYRSRVKADTLPGNPNLNRTRSTRYRRSRIIRRDGH